MYWYPVNQKYVYTSFKFRDFNLGFGGLIFPLTTLIYTEFLHDLGLHLKIYDSRELECPYRRRLFIIIIAAHESHI